MSAPTILEELAGPLIRPADEAYDTARRVWNGMIDRYPALIARAADARDVAAVVRHAREHDLPLAVRGGGHNVAGYATCDNGIVLDLGQLTATAVDPRAATIRAGAGLTWAAFDTATQAHGLATTGGLVSTTGIAGLTLGGGLGWLMRRHGLTCDNLIAAELVTADGQQVTADRHTHPDLLWALRGGGGNFGVVTAFTYRLHPVSQVLGGLVLHPAERAADVLRFYADYCAHAPDEITTMAAIITGPPLPFVPEDLVGRPALALIACCVGEPGTAERTLDPLRRYGPPVADVLGPMPYAALQRMLDAGAPRGMRNYWKSGYLSGLSGSVIDVVVEHAARMTSPLSQVHLHHMGGAVRRTGPDAAAFAHRDAEFALNIVGIWADRADDRDGTAWTRDFWAAIRPHTSGVYVNFLGAEGADRVRTAYDDRAWTRLTEVKRHWDPDNVFRLNQNISPHMG
ncbi:FAD-binding oxidoreductase [Streptomyces sp. NPDC049541]|uniref:FAD-binding oxidoreductase n=1 Tax=Streptomyces sp. NPDC049541 TaxID=3365594 RepID=UPI0037BD39B2